MAKTLLRNNCQSPITLPPPYTGIVAPGDAIVLADPPNVVAAALGLIPELTGFVSLSQVPDAQPNDGHDRAEAAAAIAEAMASLDVPLDLNGQKIINLGTPTNPSDAATKLYVDTHGGGGGGGSVTSVTSTNAYLTVANGTTTPALTVNVGTGVSEVAAGTDTRFPPVPSTAGSLIYDTGAAYTALTPGTLGKVLTVGAGGIPEWDTASSIPSGPAGNALSGTYPNPSISAGVITNTEVSATAAIATSKLSGLLTDISGNGLQSFVNASTKVARTYFVEVNGNDTTGNGSITAPFATVQKAHDQAALDYTGGEYVCVEVGPGTFSGDINITRKNLLIQGQGHRAEMFATTLAGSITVNPFSATSKFTDLVGLAGCFVSVPTGSTNPAVKATGSGIYSLILNDCYLYTNNAAATASALACDATHVDRPRITVNDCIIKTEKAGPSIVQLDRGDARFDNTQVGHNSGVTLGAAGDGVQVLNNATAWFNSCLLETRTRGAVITATGATSATKLILTNSSVAPAYSGAEDTTNGAVVGNTGGGAALAVYQTNFAVPDTSASVYAIKASGIAVVAYGALTFSAGTNSKLDPALTPVPFLETLGTVTLPSLTASLPLKLDANKTVTAAVISLSGSEVANTLPINKGGTGITATPTAGAVVYGNGTTQAYTVAGTSGQALISAGSGTPAFGALNLSTAGNVSGTLPAANQAAQTMSGDVTGTTASATVTQLRGNPVAAGILGAGDAGKALVWSGSEYAPTTITPGGGGGGGGGGLTYYMNYAQAGASPLPAVGDKQLSLAYNTGGQVNTGAVEAPDGTYATLAEFVTDLNQPGETTIPPGNWDIAAYLNLGTGANNTFFRVRVFKWDGTTLTELSTSPSDDVALASTALPTQYTASLYIAQATLSATERVVIRLEIKRATAATRTVIGYFGGNTPSHVHSTLGAPGGTGVVKVAAGIVQSPATLIFNADVDANAAIAVSKLAGGTTTTVLHGGPTPSFGAVSLSADVSGQLPVTNGGTGLSSGNSGGIPYFSSTTSLGSSAVLTANALVLGGGAGTAPSTLSTYGTTAQVLHGGSGGPSWGAVSLTADVSGTLPVTNGGTNATAIGTAGSVAYSTGSSYAFSGAGTAGYVLTSGGIGAPEWVQYLPIAQGGTNGTSTPTANGVAYGDGSKYVFTPAGSPGQVLKVGSGGAPEWGTNTAQPTGAASGDLSGDFPSPTVAKINGAVVPVSGSLTTGNVLYVSGSSALSYGSLNLAGGSGYVNNQLPVGNGGTGLSGGISGGMLYFSSATTLASSGDLTANRLVLAGSSTGPTALAAGTTTQVLHGNASGAPTWGSVSLANDVSGTLPTANGGTGIGGATPFTAGDILYASDATTLTKLAIGDTVGKVLRVKTASTLEWGTSIGASGSDVTLVGRNVSTSVNHTPVNGTSIPVNVSTILFTSLAGNVDLTSTAVPTIATSGITAGTRLTLINESPTYTVTLYDDTNTPGTKIQLGGVSQRIMGAYTAITFTFDGTYWVESALGGSGTVQSVAASDPLQSTSGGSPTISFKTQAKNTVLAGPSTGADAAPTFRALVQADIPASARPYDVAGMVAGIPASGATVFLFKATRAFTLSATAADHVFSALTAATGSSVFTVYKNALTICTATFAAAGTTATISAVANNTIAVGDVIKIVAPATADATLADIYWTLTGTV